jgi:polysaccharide biosynthesis/export protein
MQKKSRGLLILFGLLAACSSTLPPPAPGITRLTDKALPPPTRADLVSSTDSYLLGAYDEIRVDVFGIDALSGQTIQIDTSGRIAFPLAGTIEVAGKTPDEIATLIQTRLRASYVRDPKVTVNLTKIVSQTVTVEGEIEEPGIYPVSTKMTLMKAIASAKGTTEFAKLEDVVIFRTVEGKSYAALYNLRAIRNGAYEDPRIYSGDIVMVGESRGRRLFRDFLQLAPLLSAPLIVALQ